MINDGMLVAQEVADILHIGRNAVYALAKSGELASYRIGRKILFDPKDVRDYLASARTDGRTPTTSETEPRMALLDELAAQPRPHGGFVIAGQGRAADLLVERLEMMGARASRSSRESYAGLVDVYARNADAAVVHLYDQRTNSYNIPFVQRLAPGTPVVVFRLLRRWQGLAVAKGNPKGIRTWSALLREGIRIANRRKGCGSRILLDEKLIAMEANPETILGYDTEFATGLAAAEAVGSGSCDAAIVEEHAAADASGIDFVRLQHEWLDVVVSKEGNGRTLGRHMRTMLADKRFKSEFERVVAGETAGFGSIVYEC